MRVSVTHTRADMMAFQKHYLLQSSVFKRQRLFNALSVPLGVGLAVGVIGIFAEIDVMLAAVAGILAISWALYSPTRYRQRCLKRVEKTMATADIGDFLGDYVYSFEEAGLHLEGEGREQRFPWTDLRRWEETEAYIFAFLGEEAVLFPKQRLDSSVVEAIRAVLVAKGGAR